MSGGGQLVLSLDTLISTDKGAIRVNDLLNRPFRALHQSGVPIEFSGFKRVGEVDAVNMRTERGYNLSVAAPSVHHLVQNDGAPIVYAPAQKCNAETGQRGNLWWDGFVSAMVCFSGFYTGDANRPARVIVSGYETPASRALIRRLYHLREVTKDKAIGAWKIMKDDEQKVTIISSRLLDKVCDKTLERKTHKLLFDLHRVNIDFRHGFLTGALSCGSMSREGIRVEHRSRQVIDDLHETLLMSSGVRSRRAYQPYAADFIQSTGVRDAILHRLFVEPDMFPILKDRKLVKRSDIGDDAAIPYLADVNAYADTIAEIDGGGLRACAQLQGDAAAVLSANGFLVWSNVP